VRFLVLTLAVILAAALVASLTGSSSTARPAPPLPRSVLAGRPTSLPALRGKPALVQFFASWCGPCAAEAPILAATERTLGARAHVVAIDWSDSRRYALAFIHHYGWSFPVLSDPRGTAGYAYGIQGLPSSFVLDAQGRIIRRLVGPQTVVGLVRAVTTAAGA
jgi:cytochrome c biogenesis protein CcmG, thiol:disulfide interchange protein DsbE